LHYFLQPLHDLQITSPKLSKIRRTDPELSACEGLLFVVVNLENLQQTRELQDFPRGGAQSE
jgi:hypothetical protein